MNQKLNELYHSAHIVDTLIRHWLHEKTAHEIAALFLENPNKSMFSIHDQQRIEFLDSLSESDNRNAWKDYLASRSEQVVEADKRALERYLYCTVQRLWMTTKKIAKNEWYFKNTVTDVGSIIWSKKTLDFINDWQKKNPDWWNKLYTYTQLSHIPWSSVPWSYYNSN